MSERTCKVTITGLDSEASAAAIDARLGRT
jgi:hypothetical protein